MPASPSILIPRGDDLYPSSLLFRLGKNAPASLTIIGSTDLLKVKSLALICSVRCPGSVILKTYELMKKLARARIPVVGGFHSPLEKECLEVYLRVKTPVVVVFGRDIGRLRIGKEWKEPLLDGRLLLVSPFTQGASRITTALAEKRNLIVAALADRVLIPFASPGSKTEALSSSIECWGIPFYTIDDSRNGKLLRHPGVKSADEILAGLGDEISSWSRRRDH